MYPVGGFGIQTRGDIEYFDLKQLESAQNWRKKWFYVTDVHQPGQKYGVPPFRAGVTVTKKNSWTHRPNTREIKESEPLLSRVSKLVKTAGKEVSGVHLIATFIRRRVLPIQARAHPFFNYAGAADVTRTSAEELSTGEVEARVCALTLLKVGEANVLESPVAPFSLENPVPEVCAFVLVFFICFSVCCVCRCVGC